jgi:hypothetical protein
MTRRFEGIDDRDQDRVIDLAEQLGVDPSEVSRADDRNLQRLHAAFLL